MIQSPLNYTGGKFRLLPQILPLFPHKINTFVDLFCGGCNVGINVEAKRHIYNDVNLCLIHLLQTLKNLDKHTVFEMIYNSSFTCSDFATFNISSLSASDFVYIDPPYLITCATYNEQNGWNEHKERQLLQFIDELTDRKIKCALSNVLRNKGRKNHILLEWLERNIQKYIVYQLKYSYANSNYHTRDKVNCAEEVLVTNYTEDDLWNSFGA